MDTNYQQYIYISIQYPFTVCDSDISAVSTYPKVNFKGKYIKGIANMLSLYLFVFSHLI